MAENNLHSNGNGNTKTLMGLSLPWAVVAVGALLLLCTNISGNTFGVFFKPISGEFGWSRSTMSLTSAVRSVSSAGFGILMGYWADRYGPRRVLVPCFLLLAASMMATAKVHALWQYYLLQGVGVGIGGAGPFIIIVSTVARWHEKRKGLALGIASAGVGLSSIIFPPLTTRLILGLEWRWATFILGLIILITIPFSCVMKDPVLPGRRSTGGGAAGRGPFDVWRLVPRLLKDRAFLAIIMMFLFFYIGVNMLLAHMVNYATDIGISALTAASMVSAMGIASTSGRLVMGTVSDRIGTRADCAICCSLLAVSFLLMATNVIALVWVAAVLFGVGFGGTAPLIPAIMGERIGAEHLGTATGLATLGTSVGCAIGPWMGGFTFDVTGSYLVALLLAATVSVVALVIMVWLPSGKNEVWRKTQALLDR